MDLIAANISPWVDTFEHNIHLDYCCLSLMDSLISEGWAHKANFIELIKEPTQVTIQLENAQQHIMLLLDHNTTDYSQWFPGWDNVVPDALSFDDDQIDKKLIFCLKLFGSSIVHSKFTIQQLPNKLISRLISTC